MRRSGYKAPVVTRKRCRYGCGVDVDAFLDSEIGLVRQIDTEPIPIDWDIQHPAFRHRLWEYGGDVIGWYQLWKGRRTWRELRLTHQCRNPNTSTRKSEP